MNYLTNRIFVGKKILFVFLILSFPLFSELPRLLPPALQKGDLIALVLPAFYIDKDDKEAQALLNEKASWLQQQGYRTMFYPEKIERDGYFAGTDEMRAEAFMNAWHNEEAKAIWCFRGGYGSQRIIASLDYNFIKAHPKIFIGMSDTLALHQALQQNTGLVTFLAPVLKFFNDPESGFNDNYALSSLESVLVDQMTGEIPLPPDGSIEVLSHGKATGKLVGGNITMIASLCGTKWQLDTEGKILILEDTSEAVYRIDRMLWQLKEAGLLDQPKAVILGSWVNCKSPFTYGLSLEQVFDHYFKNAPYPVIRGIPSGHDLYQATLPLNTTFEVDTERKSLTILEPSVKSEL